MQSSHRRFASTDGRHGHRLATSTKTINIIDREYGKNGFSYDSTSKLSQADSCGNILKAHDHDSPRIDRANEGIIDGQITGLNGPSYEKQQARLEEMKMLLKEIKTEQKALIKARSKMKLNSDTVSGSSHKIHHSHARSDTKSRDRDDSRRDIREMSSSRDLSRGRDGRDGRNSKLKSNSSMSSNPNLQNHPNHQNLPKVSSPKAVLTNQSRVSNVGSFNVNGGQVNEPRFDISSVVSGSQIVQPEDSVSQNYTKRERSSSIPKSRPLTRYLPIRENAQLEEKDFNLKLHIEAGGHVLSSCKDLTISATNISGYLNKKSSKSLGRWNKRWFSFDRISKTLTYYASRRSTKARGIIFFKQIQDCYPDHGSFKRFSRVSKYDQNTTFCVKCTHKTFYLSAEMNESMRIWVVAIMTGAEGSQSYKN